MRWDEANRSLWPNSEVHVEFLPAMPALLLIGVQNKNNTSELREATQTRYLRWKLPPIPCVSGPDFSIPSVRNRTEQSTNEQYGLEYGLPGVLFAGR